jgi:single-strand DNA-binding protein
MNKVIFMGRLVANPEFSQTQSGKSVCKFRIAVDRAFQTDSQEKQSDFFQLVSFGKTAEFVSKFFIKGKPILVEGRIQNNNYTDKDGVQHYQDQIIADNVSFTLNDPTRTQQPQQNRQQIPAQAQQYQPAQNYQADFSDYEQISGEPLPF